MSCLHYEVWIVNGGKGTRRWMRQVCKACEQVTWSTGYALAGSKSQLSEMREILADLRSKDVRNIAEAK